MDVDRLIFLFITKRKNMRGKVEIFYPCGLPK